MIEICPNCCGPIELLARDPDPTVLLPTCTACGESWVDAEDAARLTAARKARKEPPPGGVG